MKRSIAKRLATTAVACALAFAQPVVAEAAAGGFHGGGFHGGGFHAGGIGAFHGGGVRPSIARPDVHPYYGGVHAYRSTHLRWDGGLYAPYSWGWDQPQYGYYCADPPGYYPDVTQCNSGWE